MLSKLNLLLLLTFYSHHLGAVSLPRVEINYVDTAYSAVLRPMSVSPFKQGSSIFDEIPFGWKPFQVKAQVLDVYRGEIDSDSVIELIVYINIFEKKKIPWLNSDFILSFCRSKKGIYYTSRDFLLLQDTQSHRQMFAHVKKNGTDYEGPGDCSSSNDKSLNPDSHEQ